MKHTIRFSLPLFLFAAGAFGQAKFANRPNITNSGSLPPTCSVGDIYFKSGVTPGQNLFGCTAPDTWMLQAGGSGTAQCTSPSVTGGGTFSVSFPPPVNCNVVTITAAGTVTLPTPASNASGPFNVIVVNSTPTASPFTYAGASQLNLPQPDSSTAGAVTVMTLVWTGSTWVPAAAQAPSNTVLAAGDILASNGATGPPVAAVAANVYGIFSGSHDASHCTSGAGTMVVCSGTIAAGTAAMGTSAITNATCATVVTVSATGTLTTDIPTASFNQDVSGVLGYTPGAMLSILVFPSANNVNFLVCNNTGSSITPGAITLNWRVAR